MLLGRVIRMQHNNVKTPNAGTLVSVDTGDEYKFSRPALTGTPTRWNVRVHDWVSFVLAYGRTSEVTLWKRHRPGLVITSLALVLTDDAGSRITNGVGELIVI